MVFVGDPKQLAPHTHQKGENAVLSTPVPVANLTCASTMGSPGLWKLNTNATIPLTVQHRMPRDVFEPIALSMNKHLPIEYQGARQDNVVQAFLDSLANAPARNLLCVTHGPGSKQPQGSISSCSVYEAELAVSILIGLCKYSSRIPVADIWVVSTYTAQLDLVNEIFVIRAPECDDPKIRDYRKEIARTIDASQGQENRVIILFMVRMIGRRCALPKAPNGGTLRWIDILCLAVRGPPGSILVLRIVPICSKH